MIRELMSSRRFAPLFWAQFCAALNDNVLKNGLVIILLYGAATTHGGTLVTVAGAVFIFPFFVLSGLGGELADKYVKSVVARRLKFVEIFAAAFAAVGFFLHSIPFLFLALFMFGIVAALFGPVKYAILPDQLSVGELATGNALVAPSLVACWFLVRPIWAGSPPRSCCLRSWRGRLLRAYQRRRHRRLSLP
jgi:acyl-[acyl-carrier-protein]-phospholipid O-acyltransferase / long-chain-fatty-acid--[acyl-carrier-protein] ligase